MKQPDKAEKKTREYGIIKGVEKFFKTLERPTKSEYVKASLISESEEKLFVSVFRMLFIFFPI